jgi:hypothetical protein
LFFGISARRGPAHLGLGIANETACDVFGVAHVDLRPRRARRAEGKTCELQTRGRLVGALPDQIERDFAHRRVFFLLQNLKAVDDRADRADDVVAQAAGNKGCEVEAIQFDGR